MRARLENAGKVEAGRSAFATSALDERAYQVIDSLYAIAREVNSTPARVALSWIQYRPGVTSTIIGARTLKHFEDNLAALDLELSVRHVDELDKLTAPRLNFPFHFLDKNVAAFGSSGTVINGVEAPPNPMAPQNEKDRF
jgi:aryl-alcohol dehydrogenase-like predicted oxidoreductase